MKQNETMTESLRLWKERQPEQAYLLLFRYIEDRSPSHSQDPALTQSDALWKLQKRRDAMLLLSKRIAEIDEEYGKGALKHSHRGVADTGPVPEQESPTTDTGGNVSAADIILFFLCVALVAGIVFMFYRVHKLEKSMARAQQNIRTLTSTVDHLETDLDRATFLAENADRYAHSHSTYSDSRLKTNIAQISNPLSKLLQLNGVQFEWNLTGQELVVAGDSPEFGFLAQEVQMVFPELVSSAPNGYLMVDYTQLGPIIVEALRTQQAQIAALEERLSKLES